MKNPTLTFAVMLCLHCLPVVLFAQKTNTPAKIRCATVEYYQQLFRQDTSFKQKFQQNQRMIAQAAQIAARQQGAGPLNDTIPVVVHVVADSATQALVTDAIIQSQIDVLNENYQGRNADSTRIPAAFKPLFGKSSLTFLLAKTNPYGEPTNGITRKVSKATYGTFTVDNAKASAAGGEDAWNPAQYLNIWVVSFGSSGILGISVFPGDPRPLSVHGFVCDYRAFGRGASYLDATYNRGKTTTHELGHFFNLYHIWGDDDGACTGTDFPNDSLHDDTPNQSDATYGNPDPAGIGKVVTDACSPNPPGIMYQNYMDYTDDIAMVMFTKGQQYRMETTLTASPDRAPLLNSNAYMPATVYTKDARIRKIVTPSPAASQCTTITPKVILRNSGTETLTSVQIVSVLNNVPATYNWTGSLAAYTETTVSLPNITAPIGNNALTVYTKNPNGAADQNTANDTASVAFVVPPVIALAGNTSVTEGFDAATFPPANWRIYNPDNDMTWERNATIGKNKPGSAWFNDWNNATNDRYDDLMLPNYSFHNIDSVFLKFNVAAASYSDPNTTTTPVDTLSVLLSKDCGNSFTTVYKKWGSALQTTADPNQPVTVEFFPTSSQWRTDSVNIGSYLNNTEAQVQLLFRFNGNWENNIFIDDVNLRTVTLPAALKEKGYLLLPVPFQNQFGIWFYQQPTALQYITIYNATGQLVWKKAFSGNADKFITVDLHNQPAGVYVVTMGYTDASRNVSQRIIKQ